MQDTFSTLINVEQLAKSLDAPSLVIIDCRFSLTDHAYGRRHYEQGHIPGARFVDLETELSAGHGDGVGRHPLPEHNEFNTTLSRLGISKSDQVVVYDDKSGGVCGRFWWMMRWAGHTRIAVLDGGIGAWTQAGHALQIDTTEYAATHYQGDFDDSLWVTTADVVASREDNSLLILDAREGARYRGEVEPIDPIAGHIPGAQSVPLTDNLVSNGCYASPAALKARFDAVIGEVGTGNIVHSCGSGVSACHNLLAMEHAGLTGSKLYVGSWSEWVADSSRPVATSL